jgi:hypothetical protein
MPTVVQFRRGTTVQNDAFTGATGELSIDTDLEVIRVHDGSSAGGHALVGRTATQTLTNKTLTAPTITTPTITTPSVTGNITVTGNVMPGANLTYNLGSTVTWWNVVYGKSVQAQYADLAENYAADLEYPAGTVVVFGGSQEVTTTTKEYDPRVAGIISSNPAYLMNAGARNYTPVALTGRVPCQVLGPINKGDMVVTSHLPGIAKAFDAAKFVPGCIIGKSLGVIDDDSVKTIEIVVGRF